MLTNLTSAEYTIEVRAATRSLYNKDSLYKSEPSRTHTVKVGPACNQLQASILTCTTLRRQNDNPLSDCDCKTVGTQRMNLCYCFLQPFTVLEIEAVGNGESAAEKMPSIDAVSRAGSEGSGAAASDGGGGGGSLVDVGTGVIAGVALVVMVLMLVVVGIVLRR